MLVILSVLLLTTICCARQPLIVSRFDSNELHFENPIQSDEQLMIFPTIDPNIAEDAKLTTVMKSSVVMRTSSSFYFNCYSFDH